MFTFYSDITFFPIEIVIENVCYRNRVVDGMIESRVLSSI